MTQAEYIPLLLLLLLLLLYYLAHVSFFPPSHERVVLKLNARETGARSRTPFRSFPGLRILFSPLAKRAAGVGASRGG